MGLIFQRLEKRIFTIPPDVIWILFGIVVGLFILNIQVFPLYRILIIIGGIFLFYLLISIRRRFDFLLVFFFVSLIFSPDVFFVLIYHCSWSDGISVTLTDFILFLIILLYLLENRENLFKHHFFLFHLDLPMLLLVLASLLSIINSINLTASSFQIINFIKLYLVFFIFIRLMYFSINIEKMFFKGLIILVGVQTVYFLQSILEHGFLNGFRHSGAFPNPNSMAEFFAPILVISLCMILVKSRSFNIKLALPMVIWTGIMLILSFSRGGWLSAFTSLVLMMFFLFREKQINRKYIYFTVFAIIVFVVIFSGEIIERLHFNDESAQSRLYLNKIALNMISTQPIFGVGINTFPFVMKQFYYPGLQTHAWLHTVHNQYLLVWSEMGILGIISFLWLLYGAFRYAWKTFRSTSPFRFFALALLLAVLTSALHMMADMYVSFTNNVLLWLIFAGIGAIYLKSLELTDNSARSS